MNQMASKEVATIFLSRLREKANSEGYEMNPEKALTYGKTKNSRKEVTGNSGLKEGFNPRIDGLVKSTWDAISCVIAQESQKSGLLGFSVSSYDINESTLRFEIKMVIMLHFISEGEKVKMKQHVIKPEKTRDNFKTGIITLIALIVFLVILGVQSNGQVQANLLVTQSFISRATSDLGVYIFNASGIDLDLFKARGNSDLWSLVTTLGPHNLKGVGCVVGYDDSPFNLVVSIDSSIVESCTKP